MATRSLTPNQLTVQETYALSFEKGKGSGLQGYTVAKTHHYIDREFKVPTGKKKDMYYEASKRAKDPAPSHYAESYKDTVSRYWAKSSGKFSPAKRRTMIDELTGRTKSVPGPGAYFKREKGAKEDRTKALPLGRVP